MENTLLLIFNIAMQTAMNTYIIIKTSQYLDKTKYFFKHILICLFIVGIGIILGTFAKSYPIIKPIITLLPVAILLLLLFKLNLNKTALVLFILMLILAVTEVTSVYISMIIFNTQPHMLLQSTFKTFITVSIQYLLILISTQIVLLVIRKRTKILDDFKNITIKQAQVFIIAVAIYILPQMLIFMINTYSYPISFLILNSLQFVVICIFLFFYLKNTINYEKAQSDLITTQLHNTALTSMVDGVRILKHDYNNDVQALNRICIYKAIRQIT